eukprot:1843445-Rhodomonas_salina.1
MATRSSSASSSTRYCVAGMLVRVCGTEAVSWYAYAVLIRWGGVVEGDRRTALLEHAVLPSYAFPMRCPVLTYGMQGTNVHETDEEGMNAMHTAAKHGSTKVDR